MSRILEAIQRLEGNDTPEDRSVIPISEAMAHNTVKFDARPESASFAPDYSEAFGHTLLRRFDVAHEETTSTSCPHFGTNGVDTLPQDDGTSFEHRLAAIWQEYAGLIPSALVETWVMSATWKAGAAGQVGWISGQFFDSALPIECGLAVILHVREKIEQPVLIIDGEPSGVLTRALGVSSGPDLMDIVLGQAPLESTVIPLDDSGLCFLPNRRSGQAEGLPNWVDVHSLFQSIRQTFGLAVVFCSMTMDLLTSRILRNCDDFWLWCHQGHTSVRHVKEIMKSAHRWQRQAAGAVLITT